MIDQVFRQGARVDVGLDRACRVVQPLRLQELIPAQDGEKLGGSKDSGRRRVSKPIAVPAKCVAVLGQFGIAGQVIFRVRPLAGLESVLQVEMNQLDQQRRSKSSRLGRGPCRQAVSKLFRLFHSTVASRRSPSFAAIFPNQLI